jgi:hypothetical protein
MKTLCAIFLLGRAFLPAFEFVEHQQVPNRTDPPPVISEIMADPNPVAGLPDAEYIELYNPSEIEFSLTGCRLRIATRTYTLPPVRMAPYGYVIVCDAADVSLFTEQGRMAAIEGMPALVNTGTTLTLLSPEGVVLHTVTYNDRWYGTAELATGGRSLEMIDPGNRCGRASNWHGSLDPKGGTPGMNNSVGASNPDLSGPVLLHATPGGESKVLLHFSESMDSASLSDPGTYYGSGELLNPAEARPTGPDYASVELTFAQSLLPGDLYTITVLPVPADCAGNQLVPPAGVNVAIPEPADSFDVVINEVLADVAEGQSEFFEVLNRSTKVIDLAEIGFTLTSPSTGKVSREVHSAIPFLLFPGKPLAVTRDTACLPDLIRKPHPSAILETASLFVLPDEEGILTLHTREGRISDQFHYDKSMHSPFLSRTEGVSLERRYSGHPTQSGDNWTSASSEVGYATPGQENSQNESENQNENEREWVVVSPLVFSPDGDGLDDVVLVGISPGEPGCVGDIRVFSSGGECVALPAQHALLGSETWITWEGTSMGGGLAGPGLFIIHAEIACRSGVTRKYRKVVTLLRRL